VRSPALPWLIESPTTIAVIGVPPAPGVCEVALAASTAMANPTHVSTVAITVRVTCLGDQDLVTRDTELPAASPRRLAP